MSALFLSRFPYNIGVFFPFLCDCPAFNGFDMLLTEKKLSLLHGVLCRKQIHLFEL